MYVLFCYVIGETWGDDDRSAVQGMSNIGEG